jgi:hypothetical protein
MTQLRADDQACDQRLAPVPMATVATGSRIKTRAQQAECPISCLRATSAAYCLRGDQAEGKLHHGYLGAIQLRQQPSCEGSVPNDAQQMLSRVHAELVYHAAHYAR